MRSTFITVVMIVVVVVGFTSCNLFFPFNADQICETQIRAQCRFAFNCCDANERNAIIAVDFRSEGDCVNELLAEVGDCGNSLIVQEAANQGRFTYDAALAERCLKPGIDALNACNADFVLGDGAGDVEEECLVEGFAFGTGLVKEGDACFQAFECEVADSVCEPLEDDPDDDQTIVTQVGTCKSPGQLDDDCSVDGTNGLCADGLVCDGDTCIEIDLLANGADCVDDAECDSAFCDNVGAGQPTCADKQDNDENCIEDDDCISDFCDPVDTVCADPDDIVVNACNGLQADDADF